jgi:hypothetical protein
MSSDEWTLERELCKLTRAQTEREALFELKLLPGISTEYQVRTDVDWVRGGEETYIYRFWISKEGQESGYIIKACVTLDLERGIEGTISEWLSRRNLLMSKDISVPHLVYSGQGLIIEELIQWPLWDRMRSSPSTIAQILPLLVDYTATLSRLGFAPIDGFTDLRTRGSDVVVVDFGEDMGPPHMTEGPNLNLLQSLEETLLRSRIISQRLPTNLRQWYFAASREHPIHFTSKSEH